MCRPLQQILPNLCAMPPCQITISMAQLFQRSPKNSTSIGTYDNGGQDLRFAGTDVA